MTPDRSLGILTEDRRRVIEAGLGFIARAGRRMRATAAAALDPIPAGTEKGHDQHDPTNDHRTAGSSRPPVPTVPAV